MDFAKLFGNGKTVASGIAAVLVKVLSPVLRDKGVEIPEGLEDAVATMLLVFMGVVGLGSRTVKTNEKIEDHKTQLDDLKKEISDLKKK